MVISSQYTVSDELLKTQQSRQRFYSSRERVEILLGVARRTAIKNFLMIYVIKYFRFKFIAKKRVCDVC